MASGFDFSELKKFRDKLEKVSEQSQLDKFYKDLSKEIARDLLALVIPQTPVGQSISEVDNNRKPYVVYNGGTLRRGWTARTEQEATSGTGDGKEPEAYAKTLDVKKDGNQYTVVVENPVHYASYVEYGHRQEPGRFVPALGKRLKKSWVEGKFMLKVSEEILQEDLPGYIEEELKKYFEGLNND